MKKLMVSFALAALAAGCITDTSGLRVERSKLMIDNGNFASHVRMLEQKRRDTPEGFVFVQVTVQNDDSNDGEFLYRFQWLDGDGIALPETAPSWHRAAFHGKDKVFLNGVSERRDAKDFRLVMRAL